MDPLRLVSLHGGALALTHRPRLKSIPALPAAGVTHVVTLLSEKEGARQIGDAVRAAGMTWVWLPLPGGEPPGAARTAELRQALHDLRDVLARGGQVVIHCSAGIHRTGMLGYALLRLVGFDAAEATARLAELRQVTAEGVGGRRTAWGDALADR